MARFRLPYPFNDPQDDVVFPASGARGGYRNAAPREERPAPKKRRPWWVWSCLGVFVIAGGAGADWLAFPAWLHWGVRIVALMALASCAVMTLRAWRLEGAKPSAYWALSSFAVAALMGLAGWSMAVGAGDAGVPVGTVVPLGPIVDTLPPAVDASVPVPPVVVVAAPPAPPLVPEHGGHAEVAPENPRFVNIHGASAERGWLSLDTIPSSICTIARIEFHTPIARVSIPVGRHPVLCHTPAGDLADRFRVTIARGVETRLMDHTLVRTQEPEFF